MSNLVRNDLTIEGANVKEVLDAIGFNTVVRWGGEDVLVLFNFERIVPRPQPAPPECPTEAEARYEWWRKWYSDNWETTPYDGAQPGDIFELTDTKASFKFYTRWTPAFGAVEKVAERFPACRFTFSCWEQTNHKQGEGLWENGYFIVEVPMYFMEISRDDGLPSFSAITDAIKTTAAQLVRSAAERYSRPIPLAHEEAEAVVAKVLAFSGWPSVTVRYEADDESACLCVYVKKRQRLAPKTKNSNKKSKPRSSVDWIDKFLAGDTADAIEDGAGTNGNSALQRQAQSNDATGINEQHSATKPAYVNAVHPRNGTEAIAKGFYRVAGYRLQTVRFQCRTSYDAVVITTKELLNRAKHDGESLAIYVCLTAALSNAELKALALETGSTLEYMPVLDLEQRLRRLSGAELKQLALRKRPGLRKPSSSFHKPDWLEEMEG